MDRLRIGTGGTPLSAKSRSSLDGVRRIAELGLDSLEIEFVHGVRMKQPQAEEVGALARELDVALTAHGPYYINLASLEKQKVGASRRYILDTAQACHHLGARSFTFHAAFYQKREPELIYDQVKTQLEKILTEMAESAITDVVVRPELTGKPSQFGNLEELIRLAQELEGVSLCIDFAHAHARSGGEYNTYEEFAGILQAVKDGLGQAALHDLHLHISGIEYSAKGERNHLPLAEADLKWEEIFEALKDADARGIVVCESPVLEEDALKMKAYWEKIN